MEKENRETGENPVRSRHCKVELNMLTTDFSGRDVK